MGLKGVPGLRYLKPSEKPEALAPAAHQGLKQNPPKRALEDRQDQNARPTRRTAHQAMPGSIEDAEVQPKRVRQQPARGGTKMPKRRTPNQ